MKTDHSHLLIELPILLKPISAQSAREKSLRHGHIATRHTGRGHRPLAHFLIEDARAREDQVRLVAQPLLNILLHHGPERRWFFQALRFL